MNRPLISVVTPTFNQGFSLRETIESVLSQSYFNFEYLIFDGGSTDETLNILHEYSHDPRLKWTSEPDRGQSHAINKGLAACRGEYFNWINSDDLLAPGALEIIAAAAENKPEVDILSGYTDEFCHVGGATFNRTSLQLRREVEATVTVGVYCQPSTFWKTRVIREMGGVNEQLHCSMDYDLWLRYLLSHGQSRVLKLDAHIARYRHHDNSKTNTLSPCFYAETTALFDRLNSTLKAPDSFLEGRVAKDLGEPLPAISPDFRPQNYFGWYCERRARIERHRRPDIALAWVLRAFRYPPVCTWWRLRMAVRFYFLNRFYQGHGWPIPRMPKLDFRFVFGSISLALLMICCALVFGEHSNARNIVSSNFGNTQQPRVAVSQRGTIYVVFVQGETIYLTTSKNHGVNFSPPSKVATVPGLQVGNRRGPHIAVTDDEVLITEPAKNLISTVSDDGGKTWSSVMQVNDHLGSSAEGLQDVAALPDGGFYSVWLDTRTGHPQVEGARLDRHAKAWSRNLAVYTSPEKSVCECCQPSVAADSAGRVVVMWRNLLEGDRDLYFAESHDRGGSFSAAAKLGKDSWALNFCPMDGGNLIVDSSAGIVTVWRRKGDVFLDRPGQQEVKVGEGTQPVVVRVQNDTYCIWQNEGKIIVSRDEGRTKLESYKGAFASVARSPDGRHAFLVWESSEDGDITSKFAVLP